MKSPSPSGPRCSRLKAPGAPAMARRISPIIYSRLVALTYLGEQVGHVVGVLLFSLEDVLHEAARSHVVVAEPSYDLGIRFDRYAFCDQVLLDHRNQVAMTAVLRMAALRQPLGIKVGLAAELGNPFRDPIRMLLLLARMLEKLGPRRLRVEPFGKVEMRLVAQDTDDLGCEHVVKHLDDLRAVGTIAFGDGAGLHVPARPFAHLLYVGDETFRRSFGRFFLHCHRALQVIARSMLPHFPA